MVHRIPSGTRDFLPDEMRELRAMTDRIRAVFDRAGYGEVYTPALEYERTFERAERRADQAGIPDVRRAGQRARAALGHDRADRAARRNALRARRASAALLLHGARVPGRETAARAVARVPPGRPRADRLAGAGRDRRGADGDVRRARRGRAARPTASASATRACIRRCSRRSGSRRIGASGSSTSSSPETSSASNGSSRTSG